MKKLFDYILKTCHCERGFCVGCSDSETRSIEDKTNGNVSEMSACPSGTIIQDESEAIQKTCHPEFIWQSEQTKNEFCEPASRVAGSHQRGMFTFNFYEILKQVQNDITCLFTTNHSLVKAIAFTLAETLVVMGIIGVVAALTIPNLNQSTGDREKVAKVKKIYANLEDAFGRATAVYGPLEEWFVNDGDDGAAKVKRLGERLTEFMKVSKVCDQKADTECFVDRIDDFGGYAGGPLQASSYKVILADGTSLSISPLLSSNFFVDVLFDIDGKNKGKNLMGIDIFQVYLTESGVQTYCTVEDCDLDYVFNDGWGALDWVLKTDNMDYLKADKKGKCTNGTQLSNTVTSCK